MFDDLGCRLNMVPILAILQKLCHFTILSEQLFVFNKYCLYKIYLSNFRNLSNYSADYENNNQTYSEPKMVKSARATPMRSRPTTPSKFVHTITHAPAQASSSRPISRHPSQLSLRRLHTRSKTDNNLKGYPTAFKIIPSPVASAPPTPRMSRRKFIPKQTSDDDNMETEWFKPPPEKLREAMSYKMMSLPTSPIITNRIRIGSENR